MKTRTYVSFLILVLAVLIIVESCATSKKAYIPQDNEELYGTWVNPEYNEPLNRAAKVIMYSDGTMKGYFTESDEIRLWVSLYKLTSKWSDDEGNIWYRLIYWYEGLQERFYMIVKLSDSGNMWESVYSSEDYPKKVDKSNLNYRIRYRQE